ncbi:MAG: PAS domain S-box protein [Magnetococcales bacterium]|nr:PAS domain S-box protein [Magnetococcales bacterium]
MNRLTKHMVPFVMLLLGLTVTWIYWNNEVRESTELAEHRFQTLSRHVTEMLTDHMESYRQLLLAGRGLFDANEKQVGNLQWQRFAGAALQPSKLSSVIALFVLSRENKSATGEFLDARSTDEASPEVGVEPLLSHEGERASETMRTLSLTHLYLEKSAISQTPSSQDDVDLELLRWHVESVVKGKQGLVRDQGEAVIVPFKSRAPLTSVDTTTLLYILPYYHGGGVPETIQERRKLFRGFIGTILLSRQIFDVLVSTLEHDCHLLILDVENRVEHVLYNSLSSRKAFSLDVLPPFGVFSTTTTFSPGGRTWNAQIHSTVHYDRTYLARSDSHVFWAGLCVSLLLWLAGSWIVRFQERSLIHAKRWMQSREQDFQLLTETIEDAFWIATPDYNRFNYVSPAFERIWGEPCHAPERGREVIDSLILPEDRPVVYRSMRDKSGAWRCEYRIRRSDGEERWILERGFPVIDDTGRVDRICGVAADITHRKNTEHSLQRTTRRIRLQSARMDSLLQSMPDGVFFKDYDGRYLMVNRAFEKMLERKRTELIGKLDREILPINLVETAIRHDTWVMTQKSAMRISWQLTNSQENLRHFETIKSPIYDDEGGLLGLVGVTRDMTGHKRIERELQNARQEAELANRAKSDFLASMSHEIRTPLNSILGLNELLMETPLDGEQKEYLVTTRKAGESLLAVINDVLDLSKIEAGQFDLEHERLDLHDLVRGTLSILTPQAMEKENVLVHRIDTEVPQWVRGDAGRLRQVLLNLIGNANKFTESGAIDVALVPQEEDSYLFSISDTGVGIPEEKLEMIFHPFCQADSFTTRRFGGTGLGLTICKHLIDGMGGTVSVDSVEGEGSVFRFSVPLPMARAPDQEESIDTPVAALSDAGDHTHEKTMTRHILLADDASDNQLLVTAYLKKRKDYALTCVNDGQAAVDAVRQQEFDLVLMDIQMPVMDGYEATSVIRKLERDLARTPVPIVALSAHAMREAIDRAHEAGCNGYLAKPIKKQRLLEVLERILDHGESPSDWIDSKPVA